MPIDIPESFTHGGARNPLKLYFFSKKLLVGQLSANTP